MATTWALHPPNPVREIGPVDTPFSVRVQYGTVDAQGVSYFISTGLERLEWNETTRGRSFHSKPFVSILNFQATEQPTPTEKKS